MTIEELKKALSSLDLPKKRLDIESAEYGLYNIEWLLRNILIRNKGAIAQRCFEELKKLRLLKYNASKK